MSSRQTDPCMRLSNGLPLLADLTILQYRKYLLIPPHQVIGWHEFMFDSVLLEPDVLTDTQRNSVRRSARDTLYFYHNIDSQMALPCVLEAMPIRVPIQCK